MLTTNFKVLHLKKLMSKPICLGIIVLFTITTQSLSKTINVAKWQINNLQTIINNASPFDKLKFYESGVYFCNNQNFVINKPLTLEGATPNWRNTNTIGTTGLKTELRNPNTIIIASSNVKFKDIEISSVKTDNILIDGRTDTYNQNFRKPPFNEPQRYTGIDLNNVKLVGGYYGVYAGNGMQANLTNCEFIDYSRIGYINDRRTRLWSMLATNFWKCKFQAKPGSGNFGFDSRGISFDAGNTEFPIIWNAEWSSISNCEFINTGVAVSRCKNLSITGCDFRDYTAKVDMIHVEEWSHHVYINDNRFHCYSSHPIERSRIVTLDSELQYVHHLYINDNTIFGTYNFFIAGYGTTDLEVKRNNANSATAIGVAVIDLKYYENRGKDGEKIESNQEFVSRNLYINNNPGFGNNNNKKIRAFIPFGGAGDINVTNFWGDQRELTQKSNPVPLRGNGIYKIIVAQQAGVWARLLASNGSNVTMKSADDNTTRWELTWVPPYYYNIKNVATGQYLEAHKGYTEAEINEVQNKGEPRWTIEDEKPTLWFSNNYKPRWILRKSENGKLIIKPAGNEKQSTLTHGGGTPKLIFGKNYIAGSGKRTIIWHGDDSKWWFEWVSNSRVGEESISIKTSLTVYPTSASDIVTVDYNNPDETTTTISVYNTQGKIVRSEEVYSNIKSYLNVENLPKGVYMIKTLDGLTQKFIKE